MAVTDCHANTFMSRAVIKQPSNPDFSCLIFYIGTKKYQGSLALSIQRMLLLYTSGFQLKNGKSKVEGTGQIS